MDVWTSNDVLVGHGDHLVANDGHTGVVDLEQQDPDTGWFYLKMDNGDYRLVDPQTTAAIIEDTP